MHLSQLFRRQLQTSATSFLWAVEQIPQERLYLAPHSNRWSIARLVYHLTNYEHHIAFPTMLQWQGGARPIVGTQEEDGQVESPAWNDGHDHEMSGLLTAFQTIRSQQIELASQFNEQAWHEERDVIWGHLPLKWVVTKTYQHTLEHTDEVLRAYLWWR